MKIVTMYKYFNPDKLFGGYGWNIEKVWDDWNNIYSEPYEVEIPDCFYLGDSVTSDKMYFKPGDKQGYQLTIGRTDCENGSPYLIGGDQVESIKLNVLGKIDNKKE